MGKIESVINWFQIRKGKVTYSMTNRYGPNSYDCSSAVYYALMQGGFVAEGTFPGNTESLYQLEGKLLTPISRGEVRRGDIFVAGIKGNSSGSNGHTGVFFSNQTIIHCTGGRGIVETQASGWMGGPPVYFYRLKGSEDNEGTSKPKKGETTMQCFYQIKGNPGIYYFDGKNLTGLNDMDELNILNRIYKENNEKDMPYIVTDGAWFKRLTDMAKRPVNNI